MSFDKSFLKQQRQTDTLLMCVNLPGRPEHFCCCSSHGNRLCIPYTIIAVVKAFMSFCNKLFIFIPLRAKRVGEFIEIRHKKISPTHIPSTLNPSRGGLEVEGSLHNFQNRPILGHLAASHFYKWPI